MTVSSFNLDLKLSLQFEVTNVGYFDRFLLLGSATIVEMFLMPRMVRDAVSLLHPDKTTQPFMAFGGKLYGPRAFVLGFPNKEQCPRSWK